MNDLNLNDDLKSNEIRLQLYLAKYANVSRRKAQNFIESGEVKVNEKVEYACYYRVQPHDKVKLNEKLIEPITVKHEVWLFYKPVGVLCSSYDPLGRPCAYQYIPTKKRIYTIGRLDYNSCGLLLLTNDGEFTNRVMHPSNNIIKQYQVTTTTPINNFFLKKFLKGFSINGIKYRIVTYSMVNAYTVNLWLNEGKNREIRKIFEFHNIKIGQLKRVAIGGLSLGNLKPGEYRRLTKKELDLIFQMNLKA